MALAAAITVAAAFASCGNFMKVSYSFTGASIPEAAQTVSIAYFPNNAPLVEPTLSSTMTDALQDRFARQTRLRLVSDSGDLAFEGEIIGYNVTPTAVSGTDEIATMNRLTITVRVSFTNLYEPQWNFANRTFSSHMEYNASQDLMDAAPTLVPQIVDVLVDEIFNAAVANW